MWRMNPQIHVETATSSFYATHGSDPPLTESSSHPYSSLATDDTSRRFTSAPLSMRSFILPKKPLDEDIESALCPSAFLALQLEKAVCSFHR